MDPDTGAIFGFIAIKNLQVGQVVKLNISLAFEGQIVTNNFGSITLIKSREATSGDIVRGLPAKYRINFPSQAVLPTVRSILLNDQTICSSYRPTEHDTTIVSWEHTWYSQLPARIMAHNSGLHTFETITRNVYKANNEHSSDPPIDQFNPIALRFGQRPALVTANQPYLRRSTVAPPTSSSAYECGKTSDTFSNRLSINGDLVNRGQFPWIVPLFDRADSHNPRYICGSTIITRQHLLTAAHCIYEAEDLIPASRLLAVPGMYNIDNFFDDNAILADIEEVIPHEDYIYDDDLNDADLAVLRLKQMVEFSDHIIPICPWQGDNNLRKIVGEEGYVAGWGETDEGTSHVPTYIRTTIVDKQQCSENWARRYRRNARIFCGDGQGSVPCNGDSGSGLVLKRANQYYLRGVVSRGKVDPDTLKCDTTKYVLYTDIAPFRYWLRTVTS
ncbi:phenoloxidase-activating factor 1-like [Topomyia yanbarensis]|uniref:phenoloxidase-activating factor 1-like n=1 Tax=Topomyia yanbarensis TaxID=2498891 RepID=UPI00273B2E5B|nr:phenoloxidase-activating factor 1-like [Topomyia yanbarensis]